MTPVIVRLIDRLFAGVLEDPPWVSFLEELEHVLPCHHTTMVLRKPRSGDPGILISPHGNSEAVSLLQERMFEHSPFLELPEGEVCIFHEMLTAATRGRYAEYIAYLRRFGTIDLLGVNLAAPDSDMTFRLRCARVEGEPLFGRRERNLISQLLPRLELAISIYSRLIAQRNQLHMYGASSERLAIGSLLLNEKGAVLVKNTVADRLLEQNDGLRIDNGVLRCLNGDDERALREALRAVTSNREPGADRSLKVRRGGGAGHWSLLLRSAGATVALGENTAAAVMVFIRDAAAKPQVSGALLTELFGLTRAEASLALQLVQGLSLDEAAAASGISRYTARAQLTSVFAKTQTHRQPQLVSLILHTVNNVWD